MAGIGFAALAVLSWQPIDPVSGFSTRGGGSNWCGPAGARIGGTLIAAFGVGVWLLLGGLAALDWRLLVRKEIADPGLRVLGLLFQTSALCLAMQLLAGQAGDGHVVGNGGYVGAVGALLLGQHFTPVGSAVLILTLLLTGGVLSAEQAILRTVVRNGWRTCVAAGTLATLPLVVLARWNSRRRERAAVRREAAAIADELDEAERERESSEERGRHDPADVFEDEPEDAVTSPDAVDDATAEPGEGSVRPAIKVNPPLGSQTPVGKAERRPHQLPPLDLLADSEEFPFEELAARAQQSAELIEQTFHQFGLSVRVTEIDTGPVVTQFELELEPGLRVSKVAALVDDLAVALRVPSVRFVSPIPGRNTVGVEVPNARRVNVRLRELIESSADETGKMALPLFLGKDVSGGMLNVDLAKMPHLLIAGRTGTGKSVCLNTLIVSLLMTRSPDDVRMLMIDPKMVELSPYKRVPHLMHPVITDMKKAEAVLAWAVDKMEERYALLAEVGVRQLKSYNELGHAAVIERLGLDPDSEEAASIPAKMPSIVIIADEMADMMMTCGQEVQAHIIRLAQKARAVGIHLVLATQKPTVDVITGLIKSNLPARISFQVATGTDSRVVLDSNGADKLLGNGDMLYLAPGTSSLTRAQGTFCSDEEVMAVIEHFGDREPQYSDELKSAMAGSGGGGKGLEAVKDRDDLYRQAVETIIAEQLGSLSLLQRSLSIGYGRAGRIIDHMFEDGIVGERNGAKPREVLFSMEDWEDFKAENGWD